MHALEKLADLKIAVIGDFILDKYIFGTVSRISPEAPIPVLLNSGSNVVLGGAGNVAANIASLGAQVKAIGLLGNDEVAGEVCKILQSKDIGTDLLSRNEHRVTPVKTRFISGTQQILRLDEEEIQTPIREEYQWLADAANKVECDAVILSDYGKGTFSNGVSEELIAIFKQRGIPVLVDPKGSDYRKYHGATAVSPNLKELSEVAGRSLEDDEAIASAGRELIQMCDFDFVLATRGEAGLSVVQADHTFQMPTRAKEVFDVSGAGDTLVASFTLAYAAGLSLEDSAHVANTAAGVVVAKNGTATVSLPELMQALGDEKEQSGKHLPTAAEANEIASLWKEQGHSVGFTNGCFDILHPGHISLLEQAAASCDKLIVALNTDNSVKRLKGESRPVVDQVSRARVVAALEMVDLVVLFDEDTPLQLIEQIMPQVLIKGSDYDEDQIVGARIVKENGGKIVRAQLVDGKSTSNVIQKIEQNILGAQCA